MLKLLMIVLALTNLAGCAIGNKQDYRNAVPTLTTVGHQRVAVGVQDLRPEVVSKSVDEDYLGMQRGGFGNPFRVHTRSGQPLADEMATLLTKALKSRGSRADPVHLAPSLNRDQVAAMLKATKADKSLLLTLKDWESDTYVGTELRYDAEMKVLGKSGNVLASKTIKGTDQLGSGFWNPQGVAQEQAPLTFKKKMEELYEGDIAKALSQTGDEPVSKEGSGGDKYAKLASLKKLLDEGALTQAEFEAEKGKILSAE
jgi:hypothetical protein